MRGMAPEHADHIRVEVPAHTMNMAIVRTVAAAVAARADLTVDQIEDVRLAVDEAMAYVISHARPDSTVRCAMRADGPVFDAVLSCPTDHHEPPALEPFAMTVMTALVGSLDLAVDQGELTVHWSLRREHSVSA